MEDKIRVLVVDDSLLMRKIISDGINNDPALEVIDKAKNGKEALEKIFTLKPDVVTLDINLPIIDGISVLEEVMKKQPTRVLILSAYTREGTSATMRALELGAIDFITKPSGEISLDIYKLKDTIASKIKLAAKVDLEKFLPVSALTASSGKSSLIKKLVVIGASTGGPKAVLNIMQAIPGGLPAAFLIVQHMPKGFTTSFAERISWQGKIKTKEAQDLDIIQADKCLVAPAGYHMILEKDSQAIRVKLSEGPLVNFVRPSIDVTMASAVECFGRNVVGVILSGMGKDGLDGCQRIKKRGGTVIVQDEETSVVWGMPRVVYEANLADKILPISKIAAAITVAISQ